MYDQGSSLSAGSTTVAIYKQCKMAYGRVYANIHALPEKAQKHFRAYGEFIQGYESGVIRNWSDFFMTAEDLSKKYAKIKPVEK